VGWLTPDRSVFEFAKTLGAGWVIGPAGRESLAELDRLATETGVKAAVAGVDAKALEGRRKSIGTAADSPVVSERLVVLQLKDRSPGMTPFFRELNRAAFVRCSSLWRARIWRRW
jgi:hypothetical protein